MVSGLAALMAVSAVFLMPVLSLGLLFFGLTLLQTRKSLD